MAVEPRALAETLLAGRADPEGTDATLWRETLHAPHAPDDGAALPRISLAAADAPHEAHDAPHRSDLTLHTVLGRGGMGEVWLAEQTSLRRSVAVKVPLGEVARHAHALLAEARITGALDHPNIVPVHALGLAGDGRPVLVMKRVVGTTLQALATEAAHPAWRELLARHGDRETALVETLARAADALAFAHARGIVHRDLKPENVMVGAFGEVYVMDWGCAVALDAAGPHALVGTPVFMAPEMIDPARGPLDARTDVYLLGATLHAALTGRPRHEGATLAGVLAAALASEPVAYDDAVSPSLAAVCNRATHADPAARFASAAEFRAALGHALRLRAMTALTERIAARARLDDDAASPARLEALEEARHALAPLVAEWPDQSQPRALQDRVLREIVRVALAARLLPIAEDALAALPTHDAQLAADLARVRAEQDDAQRLAALAESSLREHDARPSVRGMVGLFAFMLVNAVMLVGVIAGDEEPTMRAVVGIDAATLGVLAAATFAFRASLLANRRGRTTTAAMWLVLLAMCACDGLAAFMGLSARQAAPFSLLAAATGFAAIAVLLEMRPRARAVTALCGALLCAEAFGSAALPELATRLMSLSIVETALTAGYLIYDMARERRDAAPGT
jgi:serine/threonine-protein kinase